MSGTHDVEPGNTGVQPMSGSLSFTISSFDGWTLVAVAGEINGTTAHELHSVLQSFTGQSVVVDLSDVTFYDSSGLRTLMQAHEQTILSGGRLAIRSLRPEVQSTFEIARLTHPFAGDPLAT